MNNLTLEHYNSNKESNKKSNKESGFALITVLLLITVMLTLLATYSALSRVEFATTLASSRITKGFYAAEAGLNIRAEQIRAKFTDYNFPDGTSPDSTEEPCSGSNEGTEDLACSTHTVGNHNAVTYVNEDEDNPYEITVPAGERYQNLDADEYRYTVVSRGLNSSDEVEAILELTFKTRLVPMFQFAAFYNKDLEINPGPDMALGGPIHTNGDLYLAPDGNDLGIYGQVTATGNIYRGRKDQIDECEGNLYITYPAPSPINVATPSGCNITNCQLNVCSGTQRVMVSQSQLSKYNGLVQFGVTEVEVPEPEDFDPVVGAPYWDNADLRLVLVLTSTDAISGVEVRDATGGDYGTNNAAKTTLLNACTGSISSKAIGSSSTMLNRRESSSSTRILLEVDMIALLNCLQTTNWLGEGKTLADDSQDGLVMYFTVQGPNSASQTNRYGFRVRNAATLQSNVAGAPAVGGLTIVSDQAAYVMGNYNSSNWTRSAILSDSFNVLSAAWVTSTHDAAAYSSRNASNTTVQVAILSGTDTTGGPNTSTALEGTAGQNSSTSQVAYNGGLENYPRFQENWSGDTFTYVGSFVSLNRPRHVSGTWLHGSPVYSAPSRNWSYDTRFNNSQNLPPMTPRFVYLKQQLFLRDYEQ